MQIEIRDWNSYSHRCDSGNTEVIAAWFADQATNLMTVNSAMLPLQLYIWPCNEREEKILSGPARLLNQETAFSSNGLRKLAEAITQAAVRAKVLEDRNADA